MTAIFTIRLQMIHASSTYRNLIRSRWLSSFSLKWLKIS